MLQAVTGHTFHTRIGAPPSRFRYGVDYVLSEPDRPTRTPRLFSRNAKNIVSLYDTDNGGDPAKGAGTDWVRGVLRNSGLASLTDARILLLTQPRVLGYVFNPVSFWLIMDLDETLRAVIAEVSNTFGDRHSYLCFHEDIRPIQPTDTLCAKKVFHVSPFQPIDGDYHFKFGITPNDIRIRIDLKMGNGGLIATLTGQRQPLTTGRILSSLVRRPFGSLRVMALIHWHALLLKLKGSTYRRRPEPPVNKVSS